MNFFARQAEARSQSRRLVVLFVLAVLAIMVAVNFVLLAVLASAKAETFVVPDGAWIGAHPGSVVFGTLLVLAVVGLSSLYKSAVLRAGGGTVARSLGGTRLERDAQDPLRRRLHNVVEEMSIASGVPMPEVYVLEQEPGINAFAAGHTPANAAIAVTRGALERLNRAELQGVIAHEFSHVLNGDMRISTRLIGLVFGLVVIALIGRTVLRFSRHSGNRKGGVAFIVLAALAVMLLGYLGVFFGRLIQAAIARRREVLADSSAVQFTREPQGLKGALVKIGGFDQGSRMHEVGAEEVAHMLFAAGMQRLFATHPPLIERIKALDPSFRESEFARVNLEPQVALGSTGEHVTSESLPPLDAPFSGLAPTGVAVQPGAVVQAVGNPGTREVEVAQALARSLPNEILANLEGPGRAVGLLLALVLDPKPEVRTRQLALVKERLGDQALTLIERAETAARRLTPVQRLPVLQTLFPALRRLPREDRNRIVEGLNRLILVDGRIEIFEYALGTLARVYLRDELQPTAGSRSLRLDQVSAELQVVFSALAQHGASDEAAARRAFELGMHHVLPMHRPPYAPVPGWPAALDRALKCLDRLVPAAKEQLVEALVKTIAHDQRLTLEEAELLRAICAALHCPLPPLVGLRS
ncbi:MAG TPA: M48 family metallopeptidase [Steroidobacteraceae bacterium]|nr:M48 family metallopeptidase [Steroidobacteraceae bacterium]